MTNHEKAIRFKNKQLALGISTIEFELMQNDRVRLIKVNDSNDTGEIEIPSFITDIHSREVAFKIIGPFYGCRFTDIYINNQPNIGFNVSGLCAGMLSKELRVRFKHPECMTNTSHMFSGCKYLESLDISNFDTANVTDMGYMFKYCFKLKLLDLGHFNTANVVSMCEMFQECESLEYLNISSFDTSKVVSMKHMFYGCTKLKELDVHNFNTSNVEDMYGMFGVCELIEKLDISKFDMLKVDDMSMMFMRCSNMKDLGTNTIVVRKGTNTFSAVLNNIEKLVKIKFK